MKHDQIKNNFAIIRVALNLIHLFEYKLQICPPKLRATSDSQHYHRTRRYDGSCAVTRTSKNKLCLWLRVPNWVGVDWKHQEICDVSNIPWELSHINPYINDLWTKTIAYPGGGIPEFVGASVFSAPLSLGIWFQTRDLCLHHFPMSCTVWNLLPQNLSEWILPFMKLGTRWDARMKTLLASMDQQRQQNNWNT